MSQSIVLKPKHSLLGKRLTSVMLRVQEDGEPEVFARLKKDHPLLNYSYEELETEFFNLTGEQAEDAMKLTGKEMTLGNLRILIHFSILHANEVGAPKRQVLQAVSVNGGGTNVLAAGPSNTCTSAGSTSAGSTGTCNNFTTAGGTRSLSNDGEVRDDSRQTLEARLDAMEKTIKTRSDGVEECLKQDVQSCKRIRFSPEIPDWELETGFDPTNIDIYERKVLWVNYRGETLHPSPLAPRAEDLVSYNCPFSFECLPLRDPNSFVPGGLHKQFHEWEKLDVNPEVRKWIREKVDVRAFFRHFKGNFKGRSFDSDTPPKMYYPNASNCQQFKEFVVESLMERVKNGSLKIIGKVGECEPPLLVMPLTVEPTKPRLCHDERFLNLWIVDKPFQLDTLKEVPRVVNKDAYMASVDDKSGYDHILLSEESKTYFGIQFGGWYLVFNTLPFGFKASAYIYHTVGLSATSLCRELGVPCLQYIDDRMIAEIQGNFVESCCESGFCLALKSLYIVCQVLTRLGYTLGLEKCVFTPCQMLCFLGMIIDSCKQAFLLPVAKKERFAQLRDVILNSDKVSVKTLQRFAGKCISFVLCVPAAKLYTSEVNCAISRGIKSSKTVAVEGSLREEVQHWCFLDTWSGFVPWRKERHVQLSIATDSSLFKWGAVIDLDGVSTSIGDYWQENDVRPIHVKEGEALLKSLESVQTDIVNHRVDAYVDNMALVHTWQKQGRRDPSLNQVIKQIYALTASKNVDLKLHFVPSGENPADFPSRQLSYQDCMLSTKTWCLVEDTFGPHSCDLMALDSNSMVDRDGRKLKHFTPFKTPFSSGVNVFAQDITKEQNPYVFPPFGLITPLLKFFVVQRVPEVTMILPVFVPRPVWWPCVRKYVSGKLVLGKKNETGIIHVPTKKGLVLDQRGLRFDLVAMRLKFTNSFIGCS